MGQPHRPVSLTPSVQSSATREAWTRVPDIVVRRSCVHCIAHLTLLRVTSNEGSGTLLLYLYFWGAACPPYPRFYITNLNIYKEIALIDFDLFQKVVGILNGPRISIFAFCAPGLRKVHPMLSRIFHNM